MSPADARPAARSCKELVAGGPVEGELDFEDGGVELLAGALANGCSCGVNLSPTTSFQFQVHCEERYVVESCSVRRRRQRGRVPRGLG